MRDKVILPAKVRGAVYLILGVLVALQGGVAAFFTAAGDPIPKVIVGVGGALLYLAGAFQFVAAANIRPDTELDAGSSAERAIHDEEGE